MLARFPVNRRAAQHCFRSWSFDGGCRQQPAVVFGRTFSSSSPSSSSSSSSAAASDTAQGGEELNPETVSYLVDKTYSREVYLVGTAHVSEKSAEDVRRTIQIAKPHTVMVELCEQRVRRFREGRPPPTPEEVAKDFMRELGRKGSHPGFAVESLLKFGFSGVYALMRQYGMIPGLEFKVALEEAKRLNLPVCLGDQDIGNTMTKLRLSLGSISFAKVCNPPPAPPELEAAAAGGFQGMTASIERMKNRKQIGILRDYVSTMVPEVMDVMVGQRDSFMVDKLLHDCAVGRTVAVVGMAHMDGIEDEWRRRGGEVFLHGDNSLKSPL